MTVSISIGSGKGGTGKTMIMANLALLLARTGKKVCLVDLDIGGADAHILFGHYSPKYTVTDFLDRNIGSLSEAVHTFYSFNGLQLLAGTGNTLQSANMSYQEKQRLFRGLHEIDTDILLIDVGAGTSYHTLDFFMFADLQICVTQPDPTAILDLYTFLQLSTIRKVLGSFLSHSEVAKALKSRKFNSLLDVFELAEQTQEGSRSKAMDALQHFHPLLIVNRDTGNGSVNKEKFATLMNKYLGLEIPELGKIPEDLKMNESLKASLPISELYPDSPASNSLAAISRKLEKLVALFARTTN
jgi:flagellar biosynthesis protein FlhG